MRRTGKQALHDRVDPGEKNKQRDSRSRQQHCHDCGVPVTNEVVCKLCREIIDDR